LKKLIIVALAVLVLVGLWSSGRPAYRRYKEARALRQAVTFLERGDLASASLSVRQVLVLNPRSLEACRLMAELASLTGAPQALDWRRRIVELSPTPENRMALARTAVAVQPRPYPLAAQILVELAPTCSNSVPFHVLSAELALKTGLIAEAEAQFLTATLLEPTNELHWLNLAVVRLLSTNATTAAAGRSALERFAARTNLLALRSLVVDSLNHSNLSVAESLSRQLLARPHSPLEDQLQHLGILRAERATDFPNSLASVQRETETNAGAIYAVSSWMRQHELAPEALSWVRQCPAGVREQMPVQLATTDLLVSIGDWKGLEQFLDNGNWKEVEFLRLAWLSEAAGAQNNHTESERQWRLALHEAGERLGPLSSLLAFASSRQHPDLREDLLWRIVRQFPRERWAAQALGQLYYSAGDTRGLQKLWAWVARRDAHDFEARNNWAATSLLLNLDLPRAHQVAGENYAARPADPIIAATYAFSLHLQHRTQEGLAVFEKLDTRTLADPTVSLYYGLLLAAQNQATKAGAYLDAGARASLLPEEKELLRAALRETAPTNKSEG
jgi:hypothetical protein